MLQAATQHILILGAAQAVDCNDFVACGLKYNMDAPHHCFPDHLRLRFAKD